MVNFGAFLRSATTGDLLRAMLEDDARLDRELASQGLLDGVCVCGVLVQWHRLESGAQISCDQARQRAHAEQGSVSSGHRSARIIDGTARFGR